VLILDPEIMDILRVKKAQLPPTSAARKRKVTSAANVEESAELEPGDPGPSTSKGIQETQNSSSDGQDRDADGSTEDSDA